MKITLLAGEVGQTTSGQSRFLRNLAIGLRAGGIDVAVCASQLHPEAGRELEAAGARTLSMNLPSGRLAQARLMTLSSDVGRRVGRMAVDQHPADWYVVLSDAIVDAVEVLPADRSMYICNGDLGLMFLSPSFYASHSRAKRWLSRGLARYILQNGRRAGRYRILLANSEFTQRLMSFLYATPFAGVLYPPVDTHVFTPPAAPPVTPPYVLALARNANEQGLELLGEVARRLPLKIVGGATVPGATSVGRVSDQELAALYGGARFLVFPIVSELFGYAVAESFACGTPVLAFNSGGPAEQIVDGSNGWLAGNPSEFLETATKVFAEGVPAGFRESALRASERFSIDRAREEFLRFLR